MQHFSTVPATLTFTFLSYPIVRVSYPIVRLSYPIVRVSYQVLRLSYRENRLTGFAFIVYQGLHLSGFAFIVWIGILRHFHEQINEKPRDLLHFVIIVGLLKVRILICRNDMYLLFETKGLSILLTLYIINKTSVRHLRYNIVYIIIYVLSTL